MTRSIRKTAWPVASIALLVAILLGTGAFAMAAGGGAADGHVGGPGISDLTSGTGKNGAAPGVVGDRRGPGSDVVRSGGRRSRTVRGIIECF
jgi:hypothetical protein